MQHYTSGLLSRTAGRIVGRDDHVDVEPDHLGCEFLKSLRAPAAPPPLNDDVVTFDIPQLP